MPPPRIHSPPACTFLQWQPRYTKHLPPYVSKRRPQDRHRHRHSTRTDLFHKPTSAVPHQAIAFFCPCPGRMKARVHPEPAALPVTSRSNDASLSSPRALNKGSGKRGDSKTHGSTHLRLDNNSIIINKHTLFDHPRNRPQQPHACSPRVNCSPARLLARPFTSVLKGYRDIDYQHRIPCPTTTLPCCASANNPGYDPCGHSTRYCNLLRDSELLCKQHLRCYRDSTDGGWCYSLEHDLLDLRSHLHLIRHRKQASRASDIL